jgi:hypothetical protein
MANTLSSAMPTMPQRPGQPPPPPNPSDIMKQMNDRVPGYRAFTFGTLGVDFLLSAMLLAGGIGLLSVQPWARWLSLGYAPISILVHIVSFVYQLVWVIPATEALYAQNPAFKGMSGLATISGGGWSVCEFIDRDLPYHGPRHPPSAVHGRRLSWRNPGSRERRRRRGRRRGRSLARATAKR